MDPVYRAASDPCRRNGHLGGLRRAVDPPRRPRTLPSGGRRPYPAVTRGNPGFPPACRVGPSIDQFVQVIESVPADEPFVPPDQAAFDTIVAGLGPAA